MKLLIDTHALLWYCEGNPSLSSTARAAMENPTNDCYVSHASAWEVAIKISLKKLTLKVPYEDVFPGVIFANGFNILIPDLRHYRAVIDLPHHHGDPFDRLIVAQARLEGMTILTCDEKMAAYDVPKLW
jgi:PIN domain nuclease of toxin-antitoxin system